VAVTAMLRDREAALLSDVEDIKHQKEKELQLQKDELEFLLSGIRHAVLFSGAMIKEGSETEIVAGHQQVVARMATLTKEGEKALLEPVTGAEVKLEGGNEGKELLRSVIKELGAVEDKSISAEQSTFEKALETSHLVNQTYCFKVMLKNKKGNQGTAAMMSKAVQSLAVGVTGPSKVEVHLAFTIFENRLIADFFSFFFSFNY